MVRESGYLPSQQSSPARGVEKRRQKRFAHALPVTAKIQSCPGFLDLEGKSFSGTTGDVSLNGVRLHISQPLPPNTFLELEVTIGEVKCLLTGCVIWSQRENATTAHIGVLFTAKDESQMRSWRARLARMPTSKN